MLDEPTAVNVPMTCCSPGRPPPNPPPKLPPGGPLGIWPVGACPVGAWFAVGSPVASVDLLVWSIATTSAPMTKPANSHAPVDIQVAMPLRRDAPPAMVSSAYAGD